MTTANGCPDRAFLERLWNHGAETDEVENLAAHLETCIRCGETVETMLASDRTAASLHGVKIEADPPPVQRLRARLVNLRPAAASKDTIMGENTASAVASSGSCEATKDNSVPLTPPQRPDEIGRLGGYRILEELGRGGMGVVYKAEDLKLKRLVALKVMAPSLAADPVARKRFLREAQAVAAVHHDYIVIIHAVDEDNGVPFLAMELLQGMPMDQWLKGNRKATIPQVLRLGREIAEGLAAAHECGLIHRDIKPANIWLDSSHKGRVKILDFGLARSGAEDAHLTQSGVVVGTPAYMAPEQARGEKVDARSDLFSLGCILYRLCTGAMPFAGGTTMGLLMSLGLDSPKPVRELNADIPAAVADLVMRLLEKNPAARPQSAREVIQLLHAAGRPEATGDPSPTRSKLVPTPQLNSLGPVISAPSTTKSAAGGGKRRLWIVAGTAVVFLAAAIAAVVLIIRDKDGKKIAELVVPEHGTVTIGDEGKKVETTVAPKAAMDEAWVKTTIALPAEGQVEAVIAKLKELNPGFDGVNWHKIEAGAVTTLEFSTEKVTDISPLRALNQLNVLNCPGSLYHGGRLSDLSPLKGLPLTNLVCCQSLVSDLAPLKQMKLTGLDCSSSQVFDLAQLKGLPLLHLNLSGTKVKDLSPLKGMPLTYLNISQTSVSDLSPLMDMKLTEFVAGAAPVSDLSPLKAMPLKNYSGDFIPERDGAILHSLLTLVKINDKPAAEFWKDVAAKPSYPPLAEEWVKKVQNLPPDKQVNEVAAELVRRNPGFDGGLTHEVHDGVVTHLVLVVDHVTDISPVRALTGLTTLTCGKPYSKGVLVDLSPLKDLKLTSLSIVDARHVSDLWPLKDMKLITLDCTSTDVFNLSPLKGMPLKDLSLAYTWASDLTPLEGMPLTRLNCNAITAMSDLKPLKGMPLRVLTLWATGVDDLLPLKDLPLTTLEIGDTKVSHLSPLKGMKLESLQCSGTLVSDLSPLEGMPLTTLSITNTNVSDLSPLKELHLKELFCDFKAERDSNILRAIKTLENINGKPAAEFWKELDAKKDSAKP